MYVSITIVRSVFDELRRRGISQEKFCVEAEVTDEELADPTVLVPINRYEKILRAAIRMSDDPDLGLHVGESAPASSHVLGHIFLNCGSVRDGIALFSRYLPLLSEGIEWSLREEGDLAIISYRHPVLAPDLARFDAEGCFAFGAKLALSIAPVSLVNDPRVRLRFAHSAPPRLDEHRRIFRRDPEFGAPTNEFVFPRAALDIPYPHHDVQLIELLKARADELLAQRSRDDLFPARVRDLLRYESDLGVHSASVVAQRLGMSERSLQLRLKSAGLSLTALLDEARKEAACRALRRAEVSIKELADQLGFSEPSAFHRAFKRWTRLTPAEFRRQAERDPSGTRGGG